MISPPCIGVVVCGGRSSRMGQDKSMLVYHRLPQRYHMAGLLQPFCYRVLLSLNPEQEDKEHIYQTLADAADYRNAGPVAALLTAADAFPGQNFLLTGCDYPLLDEEELRRFVEGLRPETIAAAFYNQAADVYEPLLAYYSAEAAGLLQRQFREGQRSLQHFLKTIAADRYVPLRTDSILSADDPATAALASALIAQRKTGGTLQ